MSAGTHCLFYDILLSLEVYRKDIPNGQHKHIYGLLGTINLVGGSYLIVLTGRQLVGHINGQGIWAVTASEIIPYMKSQLHLTQQQVRNRHYIAAYFFGSKTLFCPEIQF